jgi:hypothetical protein
MTVRAGRPAKRQLASSRTGYPNSTRFLSFYSESQFTCAPLADNIVRQPNLDALVNSANSNLRFGSGVAVFALESSSPAGWLVVVHACRPRLVSVAFAITRAGS